MITPSEALQAAFDNLDGGKNWLQGPLFWYQRPDGLQGETNFGRCTPVAFCSLGSLEHVIHRAGGNTPHVSRYALHHEARNYLSKALRMLGIPVNKEYWLDAGHTQKPLSRGYYGSYWNDRPETTWETVEKVWTKAIALARADEERIESEREYDRLAASKVFDDHIANPKQTAVEEAENILRDELQRTRELMCIGV